MKKVILNQRINNPEEESTKNIVTKIHGLDITGPNYYSELSILLDHEIHIEAYPDEIHSYSVKDGKKLLYTLKSFDTNSCMTSRFPRGRDGRRIHSSPIDAYSEVEIKVNTSNLIDKMGYKCFSVTLQYSLKENRSQPTTTFRINMLATTSLGIPCNPVLNITNSFIAYFPVEMIKHIKYGEDEIIVTTQLQRVENVL